jgi:DNA-binding CsgD family transcriptional regulator
VSIIFNVFQYIETSLLFSALLFSALMFIRTRDRLARRTVFVLFPVGTLLFISYIFGSNHSELNGPNMSWLSPLFALLVITLIMASIFATCNYVIKLFPVPDRRKRTGLFWAAVLAVSLLITTAVLVMYMSRSDLALAVTNALWAFYPLCSLALFIEAVSLLFAYKKITDAHDSKLARYFLMAFIPQIAFSILDFILLRNIGFQLTHLSYTVFSIFVFVDLSAYFFRSYGIDLDISDNKQNLKEKYSLSDREMEVTEMLVKGISNQVIGERLHISINTVKSHIKNIYGKLGISSRLQLMNILSGYRNTFN